MQFPEFEHTDIFLYVCGWRDLVHSASEEQSMRFMKHMNGVPVEQRYERCGRKQWVVLIKNRFWFVKPISVNTRERELKSRSDFISNNCQEFWSLMLRRKWIIVRCKISISIRVHENESKLFIKQERRRQNKIETL